MRGLSTVVSAQVFAACVLSFAQPAAAQSCPCGPMPSVSDARHGAFAVFEGHVQDVKFLKSNPPFVEAQMRVVRAWKGIREEQVTVMSPPLGIAHDVHAACTFAFEPGESYLVYALGRGTDGRYEASVCGRTRPIAEADEDLAKLGMGSAPVSPQKPEAPAANDPSSTTTPGASTPALGESSPEPEEPPARGGCASCSVLGDHRENSNAALPALFVLGFAALVLRRRA